MRSNCPYCGNNPVPHWLNWYYESLDVLLAPVRRGLLYNAAALAAKRVLRRWRVSLLLTRALLALGVLSKQTDISRCRVRRAQVLWEEAEKRGIQMTELLLFGKPFDCYLAKKDLGLQIKDSSKAGNQSNRFEIVFNGLPRPAKYTGAALDMMDDKALLKKKLSAAGLPVPRGGGVSSLYSALEIFRPLRKPVIVKPRTGSRGRHTTTFVFSDNDLKHAYSVAKKLCYWVIVEEQLFGPVYRATVINGKLAGVLRGDSPQVTGDGRHTIAELVKIKNEQAHPGVKDIVVDEGMRRFVARQLADFQHPSASQRTNIQGSIEHRTLNNEPDTPGVMDFVPLAGQTVNLSEKIGVNYGGSSSEDYDICHPENKELFVRAAATLGDPVVGFDFIITDITKSWKEQRCGFIEANSLPFINLHHDPLKGLPRNAAALVWDMMGM